LCTVLPSNWPHSHDFFSSLYIDGVSEDELKSKEGELKDADAKMNNARERRRQLEGDVERLTREVSSLQLKIKKLEMDVRQRESQLNDQKERIDDLEQQINLSAEDQKELNELKSQKKSQEAQLKAAQAGTKKAQEAVDKLKQKMMDAGGMLWLTITPFPPPPRGSNDNNDDMDKIGTRVHEQQAVVDRLAKKLEETSSKLIKIEVDGKANVKKEQKVNKDIKAARAAIEEAAADQERCKKEMDDITENTVQAANDLKQAQEEASSKRDELLSVEGKFNKLKAILDVIKDAQQQIEHRQNDIQRVRRDNVTKLKHHEARLASLIKKIKEAERLREEGSMEDSKDKDSKAGGDAKDKAKDANGDEKRSEKKGDDSDDDDESESKREMKIPAKKVKSKAKAKSKPKTKRPTRGRAAAKKKKSKGSDDDDNDDDSDEEKDMSESEEEKDGSDDEEEEDEEETEKKDNINKEYKMLSDEELEKIKKVFTHSSLTLPCHLHPSIISIIHPSIYFVELILICATKE
jgi:peptidoglycan hydrolase CwlO-like protein